MKLLFCKKCGDLFNLRLTERVCSCGRTKGQYITETQAVYEGEHAVPLGILNDSFAIARRNQPISGNGRRFTAFVIPKECETFIKKE